MNPKNFIWFGLIGILLVLAAMAGLLYKSESDKNALLRNENMKTAQEAQSEIRRLKEELKKVKSSTVDDKQKLLDQMTRFSKEKDEAVKKLKDLEKRLLEERELSLVANDDLDKIRTELIKFGNESKDNMRGLEQSFRRKQQSYEARILSLEAELEKAKSRVTSESSRYHYNLGVVSTQNKDFESAVKEFKTSLGFSPQNASAHYNLGIIYEDYFKDKKNARFHYQQFLELSPQDSDDAVAVKEWLENLER